MASFKHLIEELVIEVLSWLPADSLLRFKCVSKSWRLLIEDPLFEAKQLHNHVRRSSDDNLCVLLHRRIYSGDPHDELKSGENMLSLLTYDDKIRATSREDGFPFSLKTMSLPSYKDRQDYLETLGGSCDGIVFFHDYSYGHEMVAIANPGIRDFRILPKSCICFPPRPHPPNYDDDYLERCPQALGVGFDPKTNDYKIVRVWDIFRSNNTQVQFPSRVEVYTLSLDSWREIDNFTMEFSIFDMPCFERYWNGAYYWYAYIFDNFENKRRVIAFFDMTYEVFGYIAMPELCQDQDNDDDDDGDDDQRYCSYSLIEMNGSLALFRYLEEKSFDTWVMDKFGVNGTWTKTLSFGLPSGIRRPLLFISSDELLMEGKEGQLVSYNLETKQVKRLPIYGVVGSFRAMFYKRSLVAVRKKIN